MKKFKLYYLKKKGLKIWSLLGNTKTNQENRRKKKERKKQTKNMKQTRQATDEKK